MINLPLNKALLQSNLNAAGFKVSQADLSDYAGTGVLWNTTTKTFDMSGGGLMQDWVSVMDYGGAGDARFVTDAAMTSGSYTLTSATAAFTLDDVGKSISINGVGASGGILQTTIAAFTDGSTVTLAAAAGTNASNQYCAFGTDNTTPAQDAVTAAESTVYFPTGNYLFMGSIGNIGDNKALVGANQYNSVYSTDGGADTMGGGSVFLLTANAGNDAGTPFITVGSHSSVTGISFFWPNQLPQTNPATAYPWAIYVYGARGSTIRNVTLINTYQGIYMELSHESLIERVMGQALYRGIKVAGCYEVDLIKDCLLGATWDFNGTVNAFQKANAIAYTLGRNDATMMHNCFAFSYKTWLYCYDDVAHNSGSQSKVWAQVHGGGCDSCPEPIIIDASQTIGLDLDEIWVTTVEGSGGIGMVVGNSHDGTVRLKNANFLIWEGQFGTVGGSGEVMVDNCHFYCIANRGGQPPAPQTKATIGWTVTGTGNFALRNCHFRTIQPHVSLGASLTNAVITGNMCSDTTLNITNNMGSLAVIGNNTGGMGTVPPGGTTGQSLKKLSNDDYDVGWG